MTSTHLSHHIINNQRAKLMFSYVRNFFFPLFIIKYENPVDNESRFEYLLA